MQLWSCKLKEKKKSKTNMFLANYHARPESCGSLSLEHWIYFYSFKPSTFLICKHSRGACGTYLNTVPGANRFQNGMDVSTWKFKCSTATVSMWKQELCKAFLYHSAASWKYFSTFLAHSLLFVIQKIHTMHTPRRYHIKKVLCNPNTQWSCWVTAVLQWRERAKKQSCANSHVKC